MAVVSEIWQSPKKEMENTTTFDMGSLRTNLPKNKRGLSRYYSGKSQSFTSMSNIHCVEDLKKQEIPEAKKRKKYSDRQGSLVPLIPCRRLASSTQCKTANTMRA